MAHTGPGSAKRRIKIIVQSAQSAKNKTKAVGLHVTCVKVTDTKNKFTLLPHRHIIDINFTNKYRTLPHGFLQNTVFKKEQ